MQLETIHNIIKVRVRLEANRELAISSCTGYSLHISWRVINVLMTECIVLCAVLCPCLKSVNWWAWFQSHICLGWLKIPVGIVSSQTAQGTEIKVCLSALEAENNLWKYCRWDVIKGDYLNMKKFSVGGHYYLVNRKNVCKVILDCVF